MSRGAQAATIENNGNAVEEGDSLIPVRSVLEMQGERERQRVRVEPSTTDGAGTEMHALRNELQSATGTLLSLGESVDALAESIDELAALIAETNPGVSPMSDLVDSIPAGRHRLLARIMLTAYMSIDHEGENLSVDTDKFLERLAGDGLCVEAGDHHLLVRGPQ